MVARRRGGFPRRFAFAGAVKKSVGFATRLRQSSAETTIG
jgi:hypothetical protein